jgi:hypothetical protein
MTFTGFDDTTSLPPSQQQEAINTMIANMKIELQDDEIPIERKQEICNILCKKHKISKIELRNVVVCQDGKYIPVKKKEREGKMASKYNWSQETINKLKEYSKTMTMVDAGKLVGITPDSIWAKWRQLGLKWEYKYTGHKQKLIETVKKEKLKLDIPEVSKEINMFSILKVLTDKRGKLMEKIKKIDDAIEILREL